MEFAFDNELYSKLQKEEIEKRIAKFDKLYLEIGGKLFDDMHASRVLPGFKPTAKIETLIGMKDKSEVIIVVNCEDIIATKTRSDTGMTYEDEVLRLIDAFHNADLHVNSVVLSFYQNNELIKMFARKLKNLGIKSYKHYRVNGYPQNISLVLSNEGLGKNEYVETTKPLIFITAPGPGSGKMATALSQLYHDNKNGIVSGYAKYETFPVWNLGLNHPVNLAYEAATVDLQDVNMIDPFHLEAYGKLAVNYNRDIDTFPLLKVIFEKIYGKSMYNSPTDMGVNMAGFGIVNDELACKAAKDEIIRRYYETKTKIFQGKLDESCLEKSELLLNKAGVKVEDRKCVKCALDKSNKFNEPCVSIDIGEVCITGHRSELLGASAAALIKVLKYFAGINKDMYLITKSVIEPICSIKTEVLGKRHARVRLEEVLIALAIQANSNPLAELALKQLPKLKGLNAHSSVKLSDADRKTFTRLGIYITEEPKAHVERLFVK